MTDARVVIHLTAEQQEQVQRGAGVHKETVELERRELAMYALAAAAAGSDILPICNAPAKRWRLLYPDTGTDAGSAAEPGHYLAVGRLLVEDGALAAPPVPFRITTR